jgi:hypothetical protein
VGHISPFTAASHLGARSPTRKAPSSTHDPALVGQRLESGSTDLKKTSVALIAPAWPAATMLFIGISANIAPSRLLSAMAPWSAWRNLISNAR